LDFENQRKVVIRRSHFKEAWSTIAGKVKNLAGDSLRGKKGNRKEKEAEGR
jgi:hypothetical protein